jgi:hypothetical protein
MGELRVTGFRCSENDPPKLTTPTSKLAGTPISDDKTVAKMGTRWWVVWADVGHPSQTNRWAWAKK